MYSPAAFATATVDGGPPALTLHDTQEEGGQERDGEQEAERFEQEDEGRQGAHGFQDGEERPALRERGAAPRPGPARGSR